MTGALRARWHALAARERLLIGLAVWTVLLALLWTVGMAPAWKTLQRAPGQHQTLDSQLGRMQALAAQAQGIQQERSPSVPDRETAMRLLQESVRDLGAGAQLSITGPQAVVRFDGVAPQVLVRHLDQWRRVARVTPSAADLQWQGSGWRGTVTLAGPGLGD